LGNIVFNDYSIFADYVLVQKAHFRIFQITCQKIKHIKKPRSINMNGVF
jgi:hypothetical protein